MQAHGVPGYVAYLVGRHNDKGRGKRRRWAFFSSLLED